MTWCIVQLTAEASVFLMPFIKGAIWSLIRLPSIDVVFYLSCSFFKCSFPPTIRSFFRLHVLAALHFMFPLPSHSLSSQLSSAGVRKCEMFSVINAQSSFRLTTCHCISATWELVKRSREEHGMHMMGWMKRLLFKCEWIFIFLKHCRDI